MVNEKHFGFGTQAVHAGQRPDPMTGSRAVPIYQTSAYIFEDTDQAANLFALQRFGNVYSRIMNPTVAVFEERIAALENGIGAVATASGQAAQHIALFSLMGAGDEFIASTTLYGGTVNQFDVTFRKVGINPVFVNIGNHDSIRRAITPRTKCIFAETLGNPKIDVGVRLGRWRERMENLPTTQKLRAILPPRDPIPHAREWENSHRPRY